MMLVFWVCTILLVLALLGGYRTGQAPNPPTWPFFASGVLVVIDLVILGAKVLGFPH